MLFNNRVQTVGTVGEFLNGGVDVKKLKKDLKKLNRKMDSRGLKAAITTMTGVTAIQLSGFSSKAFAHENAVNTLASAEAVPVSVIESKIKEQILHAFDPLVELLTTLSYPITSVMITAGCLMLLIGQKDRGYQMIINAAIGYVVIQMSPLFLRLLVGIGGTVSNAIPYFNVA